MSSYLKYLDKYEEKGNVILFYLKDFPSSSIAGNKIVKELYMHLFNDEGCQLEQIHRIDELIFLFEREYNKEIIKKSKVFSIRINHSESSEETKRKIQESIIKKIEDYKSLQ